jgi:hypothetical protein
MRKSYCAPTLAGILLLGACVENQEGEPVVTRPATQTEVMMAAPAAGQLGSELYAAGVTVRAELESGEVNTLTFSQDGTVRNLIHSSNEVAQGRWWVSNGELCMRWQGTTVRECWPYVTAWKPGETVNARSDRGQSARITLISGTPA